MNDHHALTLSDTSLVFLGGGIGIFSGPQNMSASIQRVQKYLPRWLLRRIIRRKYDFSDVHVFNVALPTM